MIEHTETQIQEAIAIVRFTSQGSRVVDKVVKAWERQLRANNQGAWFIVSNRLNRQARINLEALRSVPNVTSLIEDAPDMRGLIKVRG